MLAAILLVLTFAAAPLDDSASLPRFDVASVKLAADQAILETKPRLTPGRFRWTTQMFHLMDYAWHTQHWRISGVGISSSIYEIDATLDPNANEDQVRLMLQSLLKERFKLKSHHVSKEMNGFVLTVAKGKPKLEEAKESVIPALPGWVSQASGSAGDENSIAALSTGAGLIGVVGRRATIEQLVERLADLSNTPITDETGLAAKYYFSFQYATDAYLGDEYPNLSGALRELGLKLEKRKVAVDMLLIDHAEAVPSPN